MYDPVLNRPMFQAQNTAPPMGAKGTGITSMVTSPDPDTTMQQLKAFANPAMPTVGYEDGGSVDAERDRAFDDYIRNINSPENVAARERAMQQQMLGGDDNFSAIQYGPGDRGLPPNFVYGENGFFETPQLAEAGGGTTVTAPIDGGGSPDYTRYPIREYSGDTADQERAFDEYHRNYNTPQAVAERERILKGLPYPGEDRVYSGDTAEQDRAFDNMIKEKQRLGISIINGDAGKTVTVPTVDTTVTVPTVDTTVTAPTSRYTFDASKYMPGSVNPTANVQTPYDMGNRVSEDQMRGIASVPQPTGNFYQPSFAELPKYADGGPVDQNALFAKIPNAFYNYNAALNHREGKADNAVRTDTVMPTGPGQVSEMPSGYGLLSQGTGSSPLSQLEARANLAAPTQIGKQSALPMGGGESYDIFKSGISSNIGSSGSSSSPSSSISGKGVIIQTYADGGPVQHFQEGGPAVSSMWQNFLNSLTVKGETQSPFQGPTPMRKENYQRPGLPDIGLRIGQQNDYRRDAGITGGGANYVEPIDVGSGEPPVPNVDAERRELGQSVDRFFNPTPEEIAGQQARMEEQRNRLLASGVNPEDVSRMFPKPTQYNPSVSKFENPYGDNPVRESDERARIEKMEGPRPMPPEGRPAENRGSISTELNKIREDRKAQSSADRRENALMALMSAGFGMAAGKSRHALQNLAEGGQQGIATFANLEKGRREDDNRRYLGELQQRQIELHERELKAKEPLYAAQTELAKSTPAYRAEVAATRADLARQRAIEQASKEYNDIIKNGTSNEAMRIMADKTGAVGAALKQELLRKHFQFELKKDSVQQYDSQNIRPSTTSE